MPVIMDSGCGRQAKIMDSGTALPLQVNGDRRIFNPARRPIPAYTN